MQYIVFYLIHISNRLNFDERYRHYFLFVLTFFPTPSSRFHCYSTSYFLHLLKLLSPHHLRPSRLRPHFTTDQYCSGLAFESEQLHVFFCNVSSFWNFCFSSERVRTRLCSFHLSKEEKIFLLLKMCSKITLLIFHRKLLKSFVYIEFSIHLWGVHLVLGFKLLFKFRSFFFSLTILFFFVLWYFVFIRYFSRFSILLSLIFNNHFSSVPVCQS